jgi:hypothetical protein
MSLDPYIVIEYIKSSVDIILNLKFEEIEKRLIDKTNSGEEGLPSARLSAKYKRKSSSLQQNRDKDNSDIAESDRSSSK